MNRFFLSVLTICVYSLAGFSLDLQKLRQETEESRGLKFKNEIAVSRISPGEMRKMIIRELDRQFPGGEFGAYEKSLKAFGLIPAKADLRKAMEDLLGEQVAGLYDPRDKKLYITEREKERQDDPLFDLSSVFDLQDVFIVHELVHALTDQHFDLVKSLKLEKKGNDDELAGALAVAEGDATLTMFRYMSKKFNLDGADIAGMSQYIDGATLLGEFLGHDVPAILGKTLLFSYMNGMSFVSEVTGGDRIAIDRLYKDPPVSTEQVLHPRKYIQKNDPPKKVAAAAAGVGPGSGAAVVSEGTWGEFATGIILEEWGVDEGIAAKASEGWGGDRYVVLENKKGGMSFLWNTLWDTEKDAAEFEAAIMKNKALKVSRKGYEVKIECKAGISAGESVRKGDDNAQGAAEN